MRFHHVEGHLGYDRDGLLPAIDIELTPHVNRAGLRWNTRGRHRHNSTSPITTDDQFLPSGSVRRAGRECGVLRRGVGNRSSWRSWPKRWRIWRSPWRSKRGKLEPLCAVESACPSPASVQLMAMAACVPSARRRIRSGSTPRRMKTTSHRWPQRGWWGWVMVTDSKDGWNDDVVYCGYADHAWSGSAGACQTSLRTRMGSEVWTTQFWIQTRTIKPRCGAADMGNHKDTTPIRARCRYRKLLRFCMLMPPSRTRKTCLRSNSAPRLAGENVQHVDMLGMSHSVCLYALDNTSYIIA